MLRTALIIGLLLCLGLGIAGAQQPADPIAAFLAGNPGSEAVNRLAKAYLDNGLVDLAERLLNKAYQQSPAQYPANVPYHAIRAELQLLKAQLIQGNELDSLDKLFQNRQRELQAGIEWVERGHELLDHEQGKLSAEMYVKNRTWLLRLEARLSITRGDESYRTRGARPTAQAQFSKEPGSALSYYSQAGQALYQAAIIGESQELNLLAGQLDDRMSWLRHGLFFGGLKFFEMTPFIDGSEAWKVLPWLKDEIAAIQVSEQRWMGRIANAKNRAAELTAEFVNALAAERRRIDRKIARLYEILRELQIAAADLNDREKKYSDAAARPAPPHRHRRLPCR